MQRRKQTNRIALALLTASLALFFTSLATGQEEANLIPNSEFDQIKGGAELPWGWHREVKKVPGVSVSQVFTCRVPNRSGKFLALVGGQDRGGRVGCRVQGIRPHTDYLLEFLAYRPQFTNGVYLEVEIFGQRHLINQHFTAGQVQPIFMHINSRNCQGKTHLALSNPHSAILAFGSPSLRVANLPEEGTEFFTLPQFFPIGIYDATLEGLQEIRAAGFNAVQSYDSRTDTLLKLKDATARLGLKFLPNIRPQQTPISKELANQGNLLGFYIEDEPEGRSVSPSNLKAFREKLHQDHPGLLTAAAMLRPQMVREYREAADIFLLDPYPVPSMPLTWLADTLEEGARHVARERLWAVIQAFGGGKYAKDGWPRRPTYLEMRCLTYLALVHGAQGLFYFSYPEARADDRAWQDLRKIIAQLNQLRTWLSVPNEKPSLQIEMLSPFQVDAMGRPAVHFCQKSRNKEKLLVLVNVIDRPVSFFLGNFPSEITYLEEIFLNKKAVLLHGNIREELGPYEVRLFRYSS